MTSGTAVPGGRRPARRRNGTTAVGAATLGGERDVATGAHRDGMLGRPRAEATRGRPTRRGDASPMPRKGATATPGGGGAAVPRDDAPPAATLAEQVYRRLRESIQNHTLKGHEVLSEALLARQFGVSRTPVREALKWLAAKGLVEIVPRRGTFVSLPDIDGVHEIFELRQALEGMAARLAAAHHDAGELAALRARLLAAWEARRGEEVFDVGREFHAWIIRSAGNRRLEEHLATVRSQTGALFSMATWLEGQMDRSVEEYRAVMDALARGDGDGAEVAMRRHIESVRDNLLNAAPAARTRSTSHA